MDLSTITVADFKAFFGRDFPFAPSGITDLKYVQDADITRAFAFAKPGFNQGLFGSDDTVKTAYLLLTAHYLASDLQNSAVGIGGIGTNTVSSRTVGNVTETYQVSKAFVDNPILGFLAKTSYGQRYLEFITPYLVGGGIGVVMGTSQP